MNRVMQNKPRNKVQEIKRPENWIKYGLYIYANQYYPYFITKRCIGPTFYNIECLAISIILSMIKADQLIC